MSGTFKLQAESGGEHLLVFPPVLTRLGHYISQVHYGKAPRKNRKLWVFGCCDFV